jgi:hypothetical protein
MMKMRRPQEGVAGLLLRVSVQSQEKQRLILETIPDEEETNMDEEETNMDEEETDMDEEETDMDEDETSLTPSVICPHPLLDDQAHLTNLILV